MIRRYGIVYRHPNCSAEICAEWFETKDGAIARADKVAIDTGRVVSLVEEIATVRPVSEWTFR